SKREIGRAAQWDLPLDLSGLSGVTLYEPEELVLSAKAGTPLAEIEELVASRGQELAFEPMDYGPVLGRSMGRGTLGGALATNLSGPRRIKAGAARDHFLGVSAVSGRAQGFTSAARMLGAAAAGSAITAFRLEGVPPSIAQRKAMLERLLEPDGVMLTIGEAGSRALWQAVRDATAFAATDGAGRPLWRVSTAPTL